jgi:hypothetical protein
VWAGFATIGYLVGAILCLAVAGRGAWRWTVPIAAALFCTLVPLVVLVSMREGDPSGYWAQSETGVVEAGAGMVFADRNPYTSNLDSSFMQKYRVETRSNMPYLPPLLVFGVPKATGLGGLGDARIWMAVGCVAAGLGAARLVGWRVLVPLVCWPFGSMALVVGSVDPPVIAALVLAYCLVARHLLLAAGIAAGIAACFKLLALAPVLALIMMLLISKRRRAWEFALPAVGLPTAAWLVSIGVYGRAVATDAFAFPVLEGSQRTTSALQPGDLLTQVLPRWSAFVLFVVLVGIGLLACRRLVRVWDASTACVVSVLLIGSSVLLIPGVRLAHLAYAAVFAFLALVLRQDRPRAAPPRRSPEQARLLRLLPSAWWLSWASTVEEASG